MKDLYLTLLREKEDDKLSDLVDSLSHVERIALRMELVKAGCNELARNLYYDYDKQTWIE